MVLTDGNGQVYRAHFRHVRLDISPGFADDATRALTECTLHKDECPDSRRPCGATVLYHGTAYCSVADNFERRVGHRLAFQRALLKLAPSFESDDKALVSAMVVLERDYDANRDLRAQLWAEYLRQIPVKKPKRCLHCQETANASAEANHVAAS